MRGSEFLRKARDLARRRKVRFEWAPERGAGTHGTLYFADRFTVVKHLGPELSPGLLAAMCRQLGIRKEDL